MSLRFIGSLLAVLVPGVVLAQTTITITPETPTAGFEDKTVFNLEDCNDALTSGEELDLFKVDIAFAIPPITATTFTISLNDKPLTGLEDQDIIGNDSIIVSLTMLELLATIGATETTCESGGGGQDTQLVLSVEVDDGVTPVSKETNGDDSIFFDTIPPEPALGLAVSGGENTINVSWESNDLNSDADDEFVLPPQEDSFLVQCRIKGEPTFVACETVDTAAAVLRTTIDNIGGEELVNGVAVEVQIVTVDLAGNSSAPTAIVEGTPQVVLDFGENFNGAEQGGCAVGHGEGQLLWIGFLIGVISLLRRNRDEALV